MWRKLPCPTHTILLTDSTANYTWQRGTELEDGTTLGNTITNNRQITINGNLNMETLYNHFPFLRKTTERFKKAVAKPKKTDKKADKKAAKDAKAAKKEGKQED